MLSLIFGLKPGGSTATAGIETFASAHYKTLLLKEQTDLIWS
jgi:hypothetical protein